MRGSDIVLVLRAHIRQLFNTNPGESAHIEMPLERFKVFEEYWPIHCKEWNTRMPPHLHMKAQKNQSFHVLVGMHTVGPKS